MINLSNYPTLLAFKYRWISSEWRIYDDMLGVLTVDLDWLLWNMELGRSWNGSEETA